MKRALIKRNVPITKIFGCYKKNDIPKRKGQQKKKKIDYFIPWNEICVVNMLILIRYDPKEKQVAVFVKKFSSVSRGIQYFVVQVKQPSSFLVIKIFYFLFYLIFCFDRPM